MPLHYLGHKVSADRLELLPEELDAVKKLAPAKNIDKVHQILGLLGYYWSFAPVFADITIPITNLLKKNIPFNWSHKCQAALDDLKEFFVTNQYYNFLTLIKFIYYIPMLQTMCMSHLVYCFLHATGCRVKLKAKTETEHRWI